MMDTMNNNCSFHNKEQEREGSSSGADEKSSRKYVNFRSMLAERYRSSQENSAVNLTEMETDTIDQQNEARNDVNQIGSWRK